MDFATIVTAVSSVGFPIIACIMVYKGMIDNNKESNAKITEMMRLHSDEIKALQKSLDDNTAVITRLIDRIDLMDDRKEDDGK